jgi:hypothetical protein
MRAGSAQKAPYLQLLGTRCPIRPAGGRWWEGDRMKKVLVGLLLLVLPSLPVFSDMSKKELQSMYVAYLSSQNIPATIDSDGDVRFQHSFQTIDINYWIIVHEDDQQYFHLYSDGLWSLNSGEERQAALRAVSTTTWAVDIAKVALNSAGNNIVLSAEALVVEPQDFQGIFQKMLSCMDAALVKFAQEMH